LAPGLALARPSPGALARRALPSASSHVIRTAPTGWPPKLVGDGVQVVPGMRFLGKNRGTILFVNGGTALVEKDPEILAGILWDLHAKRDRFRAEVATG
jgi:hypothetical protein